MTDKEKLEKIKRLADAMYNKMAYLTSDTRPIRQAMEDYHNFIVHEYNKDEQVDKHLDFEHELYKAFGQVKDFTLGMRIAKRFYDMGKKNQEYVSDDLGEYINELSKQFPEVSFAKLSRIAVRVAKWQMAQMMKDATEVTVHIEAGNYPYIPQMELYDYDKDIPLAKEGDKYKVVLIKEE